MLRAKPVRAVIAALYRRLPNQKPIVSLIHIDIDLSQLI